MEQYTDKQFEHIDVLIDLVIKEHENQIKKWGVQTHSLFEWYTYAGEELGETAEAIAEYVYRGKPKEEIVKEAIQVATLSLKIAEMCLNDKTSNTKRN